jgi:hypothetical protein
MRTGPARLLGLVVQGSVGRILADRFDAVHRTGPRLVGLAGRDDPAVAREQVEVEPAARVFGEHKLRRPGRSRWCLADTQLRHFASALGLSPHPRVRSRIPETEPEQRDDIINELLGDG